ncbi:hypothetical protein N9959_02405 [Akkermansiaceae bacterium]|nr:hypothetical protein [Akkermansiaceae bacterium]
MGTPGDGVEDLLAEGVMGPVLVEVGSGESGAAAAGVAFFGPEDGEV